MKRKGTQLIRTDGTMDVEVKEDVARPGRKLFFVTSNNNKVRELAHHIASTGFVVEQRKVHCPEIQADTLEEVVSFSLSALADQGESDVVIEDSGFFVDALCGFPGVYSAFVHKTLGNDGILRLLGGVEDRRAVFKAVIGILIDGKKWMVSGECVGNVSLEILGDRGFGYDPIFIPGGEERTFGDMSVEEKNRFSHRARAAEELVHLLKIIRGENANKQNTIGGCGK